MDGSLCSLAHAGSGRPGVVGLCPCPVGVLLRGDYLAGQSVGALLCCSGAVGLLLGLLLSLPELGATRASVYGTYKNLKGELEYRRERMATSDAVPDLRDAQINQRLGTPGQLHPSGRSRRPDPGES